MSGAERGVNQTCWVSGVTDPDADFEEADPACAVPGICQMAVIADQKLIKMCRSKCQ